MPWSLTEANLAAIAITRDGQSCEQLRREKGASAQAAGSLIELP
jgi:hypothetical protein